MSWLKWISSIFFRVISSRFLSFFESFFRTRSSFSLTSKSGMLKRLFQLVHSGERLEPAFVDFQQFLPVIRPQFRLQQVLFILLDNQIDRLGLVFQAEFSLDNGQNPVLALVKSYNRLDHS